MSELRDRMTNSPRKTHIFRQTAEMISAFIADMGGVKGFTLRSAISAAQRARPDLLDSAAHRLLPDFLEALEPLFQSWDPSAVSSFEQYLKQNEDHACDALLAVADHRASNTSNRMVASVYSRLRDGARGEVAKLLTRLGRIIDGELRAQANEAA